MKNKMIAIPKALVVSILTVLALVGTFLASYKTAPPAEPALGASAGPEHTEEQFFRGGAVTGGNVVSTTTAGSAATLVAADIVNAYFTRVTIGGAVATGADFTYTLPASTTLRHFLPNPGERTIRCFMLTATTSSSQLIFAGGTGVDLRFASSTPTSQTKPSLFAGADKETCFTFVRRPDNSGAAGSFSAVIEVLDE